MRKAFIIIFAHYLFSSCSENQVHGFGDSIIAKGQMPDITKDADGNLHLVYGIDDSVMYCISTNEGKSFSLPSLIGVIPHLAASHTRGPQIASTNKGVLVIACNSYGDIFSYNKIGADWRKGVKINDMDTTAKENLIALSANGTIAFAVWLDLRDNKKNKIFGARSTDGGLSWSKNSLIYTSPDSTVCECCKPSVAVKGQNIVVMFRNWLNGSRDMYISSSVDGGNTFGNTKKLGSGTWKLNGCPMDGGGLTINARGTIETVWRRQNKIFTSTSIGGEHEIGEGRDCTITQVNDIKIYGWVEKGYVVITRAGGEKKKLGKGNQLVMTALDKDHLICVWENENQIHASTIEL